MVIHQRPHIERAYETFITDKVAASKSPAIQRPAVSDRDSKFHYSKITLAANDDERQKMSSVPYLAGLATMMYKVHFTSGHLNYHTSFLGQFMHDPSQMAWLAVQEIIIYDYYNRHVDVIMYGGEPSIPRAVPLRRVDDFLESLGFVCWCTVRTTAGDSGSQENPFVVNGARRGAPGWSGGRRPAANDQ